MTEQYVGSADIGDGTRLVLLLMLQEPEMPWCLGDIMAVLNMNPGNVHYILDRLVKAEWLTTFMEPRILAHHHKRRARRFHRLTETGLVRAHAALTGGLTPSFRTRAQAARLAV